MNPDHEPKLVEMSPRLKQAVEMLTDIGMDVVTAVRLLADTRPELFTTPGDEIAKLLAEP